MSGTYIVIGIAWLVITILLAVYITGWRMKPERHFGIGFRAMAASYFLGAILLFVIAIASS